MNQSNASLSVSVLSNNSHDFLKKKKANQQNKHFCTRILKHFYSIYTVFSPNRALSPDRSANEMTILRLVLSLAFNFRRFGHSFFN